jgi:hypothetical protein
MPFEPLVCCLGCVQDVAEVISRRARTVHHEHGRPATGVIRGSSPSNEGAIDCKDAVGALVPVQRGTLKPAEHLGALEQPSHV